MIDKRWKGRILTTLRKLSLQYPPRKAAKKAAQVAPGTYKCTKCGCWMYEGDSDKNYEHLIKFAKVKVLKQRPHMDHIKPVIDPTEGFVDWNTVIDRMFIDESGWNALCEPCHSIKTQAENKVRKTTKRSKKRKKV